MANDVEILINHSPYETRVALLEDGVLQDVFLERERRRSLVGNVYKGRVQRVLPGMDAAFVDIGLERAGFLHAKNMAENEDAQRPIAELLREGQTILVQIIKDPISNKGARLATTISIPSRFLVYLPNASEIGVSFKIVSEEQRQFLRELLTGFHEGGQGGFIIRTAIKNADFWAMRADAQYLKRVWESIQQHQKSARPGSLIYGDLPLYLKVLRDFVCPNVSRIWVDHAGVYQQMLEFAHNFLWEWSDRLHWHQDKNSLFQRYGIEEEIERSLERQVRLKSGGHLIIDQTEAMTTIDVNTGAFVGQRSQHETIFKTNLEAAKAIARQLRLRNLGGMIMIDFIDMEKEEHQKAVVEALQTAMAGDKNKYTISPMSQLGIIEMTRKRTRESLPQMMCQTCPSCQGRGHIKSTETVVYQIFRELMHEAREFQPSALTVVASGDIIDFIQDEESLAFSDLQALLCAPIYLQSEPGYHLGQYHINVHRG